MPGHKEERSPPHMYIDSLNLVSGGATITLYCCSLSKGVLRKTTSFNYFAVVTEIEYIIVIRNCCGIN
jgi:hypothetical protein